MVGLRIKKKKVRAECNKWTPLTPGSDFGRRNCPSRRAAAAQRALSSYPGGRELPTKQRSAGSFVNSNSLSRASGREIILKGGDLQPRLGATAALRKSSQRALLRIIPDLVASATLSASPVAPLLLHLFPAGIRGLSLCVSLSPPLSLNLSLFFRRWLILARSKADEVVAESPVLIQHSRETTVGIAGRESISRGALGKTRRETNRSAAFTIRPSLKSYTCENRLFGGTPPLSTSPSAIRERLFVVALEGK